MLIAQLIERRHDDVFALYIYICVRSISEAETIAKRFPMFQRKYRGGFVLLKVPQKVAGQLWGNVIKDMTLFLCLSNFLYYRVWTFRGWKSEIS